MAKALRPGQPQGFSRRASLNRPVKLVQAASESQVQEAIEATYKQLLNRVPFAAERLSDSESQFRNQQLTVAEFVGQLAGSDLFQQRLNRMAPLRAASAAYLALLGRAAQPSEVSQFLSIRANRGQLAAIENLERKDHVILIDDLRIIRCAFPWGETSYGNIDFLQQIQRSILSINPKYKFSTLDGYIADDVLLAYV
jgi:hypothetical protein